MRTVVFVIVAAGLATGLARSATAQQIIAHRGASFDAPENTLAAFRLAWEQQADGVEGDFYLTKDLQIVCIHDKTTGRVAPDAPERRVSESTLADLRRLDVGRWKDPRFAGERIPTLQEVLDIIPDAKQFFVEIKCGPEILPVLQPQLESSGLDPRQITIICFNEDVVAQARQQMPQYKVNWLTSYKQEPEGAPWKPDRDTVIRTLLSTRATGLGTRGELGVVDAAFASALRGAGREFHVWTINEAGPAQTFQALGVDSITTDRPAFLREALSAGRDDSPGH